jgi:spore maturation protein CgeB
MLTNSVILRVKSDYVHWCDSKLQAGKHYIEVKEDLSDLKEKIDWCKTHDKECKKIAKRGFKAASKILTDDYIEKSFVKILKYA